MGKVRKLSRNVKIKIDDHKWRKLEREVRKLKGAFTTIGLHSDEARSDGSKQALVGFTNEFGATVNVTPKMRGYLHSIGIHLSPQTKTITIPERSWMRSWFDGNLKQIKAVTTQIYKKVLSGQFTAKQALATLGAWAQTALRKSIIDLKTPANSEATIKAKGSSNPLIDTGSMLNAVHHKESFGGKVPS